ncbi:MAG: alpha-1,2-fucosyltransferase [Planctomycetota bacterium]
MWIVARKYGQLANRLFLFANLIGAARHYGVELRNPCFAEYADWFPSTRYDLWCRYRAHLEQASTPESCEHEHSLARPERPSLRKRNALMGAVSTGSKLLCSVGLSSKPFRIVQLKSGEHCDLLGEGFQTHAESKQSLLLRGWLFRSPLIMDHRVPICEYFSLDHSDQKKINEHLDRCRQDSDLVVGVHIRRGDYKTFQGGRYFYDDADYANWMHSVQEQVAPRRVRFLVCSQEPPSVDHFDGLRITPGPGSARLDLYSLAETDWMIGPPSTFTAWAAYYGLKPRVELTSSEMQFVPPVLPADQVAA